MLTRRRFLVATGALAAGAVAGACGSGGTGDAIGPEARRIEELERARRAAGQRIVDVRLDAVVGPVDLGGRVVETWSYGGELPGREIRLRRGDLLRAEVANGLPQPTTVHWHGIALRNDMDGVPELTQPPIEPRATFRYEFTVPDAGSYMFHLHVGTQLDRRATPGPSTARCTCQRSRNSSSVTG